MPKQFIASALTCTTILLAACGGGSEGASGTGSTAPGATTGSTAAPENPTKSLANNETEAQTLAQSTLQGSAENASTSQSQNRLSGLSALGGVSSGAGASGGFSAKSALRLASAVTRITGKETVQLTCAELTGSNTELPANEQITNCAGSISIETNITQESVGQNGAIAAGTFYTITFNGLSYETVADGAVSVIGGSIRIEYVQAFTISPLAGEIRFVATGLVGVTDGQAFGPESIDYRLRFDGSGSTIIADGVRLDGLSVNFTDADDYVIDTGTAIDNYDDGFIKVEYANWRVIDGVPQAGSRITVTGTNGTATLLVTSVADGVVSVTVTITAEGSTLDYNVQASIGNGQVTIQ